MSRVGIGVEEGGQPHHVSSRGSGGSFRRVGNPAGYIEGRPSGGCVLNGLDRTPRTIVFVLHEEEVNQFSGMAFFGGMSFKDEVSVLQWIM